MQNLNHFFKNLFITLLFLILATLTGYFFSIWNIELVNVVFIYLLAVVLTARFTSGYTFSLIATALSFLLFNWFFTEPYYSLKINDPTYIITIIIMTITALVISALTSKVIASAENAKVKEEEANALYQMTSYLSDAESSEKIASLAVEQISKTFECQAAFVLYDENTKMDTSFIQQKDGNIQIHRELDNPSEFKKTMENLHTEYDFDGEFYNYPIFGRTKMLAVLRIPEAAAKNFSKAKLRLFHSMMESISIALDRFRIIEEQAKSKQQIMQERYRGNLLRAISHDLRTPLSGIMGTSEMLMGMNEEDDIRYSYAKDIFEDANWLHSLVENILNLTKFQEGHLKLNKEYEAVEEVIGAALAIVEKRMKGREINVEVPENILMVAMDARLISQVLVNLLDNAYKHSEEGTSIYIKVVEDKENDLVRFSVEDEGTGIPEDAIPNIFQMFYRVENHEQSKTRGVGIGLTICQSIIEAHGGKIYAENREEGGARFSFTLVKKGEDDEQ